MKRFIASLCLLVAAIVMVPNRSARAADAVPVTVLPSELIVLDQFGLSPKSITRPAGPFVLILHNRLPERDETAQVLLIGAAPGVSTPTLVTREGYSLTGQVLDLATGSYVVSFKNHPSISVTLTVVDR